MADYGNNRIYKISDVRFDKSPLSTFDHNGSQVNFIQYYEQAYGKRIMDKKQPLLQFDQIIKDKKKKTEEKRTIFLIPEICKLCGLTDDDRKDRKIMQKLANFTKLDPKKRIERTQVHAQKMNAISQKDFNIKIQENLQIDGYQVRDQEIILGKNQYRIERGNFMKALRNPIREPMQLKNWLFVYWESQKGYEAAEIFYDTMKKCSKAYDIKIQEPIWIDLRKNDGIEKVLKEELKNKDLQLVLVMVNKFKRNLYPKIKQICFVNNQIPCQVVDEFTVAKGSMSPISNIILQMNVKLGKPIWELKHIPNFPEDTMIVGADVVHIKNQKSLIGFCASMNQQASKYYSQTSICERQNQEIMKTVGSLLNQAIVNYMKLNKKYPRNIIVYRDGVGESQFDQVLETEVKSILDAFEQISKQTKVKVSIKLMYVVVQKIINNRFFIKGDRGLENPNPGSIIPDQATSTKYWDFYLIAQKVTQGTCTPTKYTILHNTTDMSESQVYELTYQQCFNYQNWQGAIKVPAQVQYASKLAYFVQTALYAKQPNAPQLQNQLYFL